MLPTLEALQVCLNRKFSHSDFDLTDLQLLSPGVSVATLRAVEASLAIVLPADFARMITSFNFCRLSLSNMVFAYGPNLEKFTKVNLGRPFSWWGEGPRPPDQLLVASTDGHELLLCISTGKVSAIPKTAHEVGGGVMVATNFEILVRIAGAIALGDSIDERTSIAARLSGIPFWKQLACGTA